MNIEDLFALCKVLYDARQFLGWIFQSFGGDPAAEIKSEVGAVNQLAKTFEPLEARARPVSLFHAVHYWGWWIIKVAGHLDIVFIGYGHYTFEKKGRPLKHLIAADNPSSGQRLVVVLRYYE